MSSTDNDTHPLRQRRDNRQHNTRPFKVLIKGHFQITIFDRDMAPTALFGAIFVLLGDAFTVKAKEQGNKKAPGMLLRQGDGIASPGLMATKAGGRIKGKPYLLARWSETERDLRPLARRRASTLRPSFVAILSRKPCLFTLLRLEGWNVLFILFSYYVFIGCQKMQAAFTYVARQFGVQN